MTSPTVENESTVLKSQPREADACWEMMDQLNAWGEGS
jgi:hypothetical protein